MERWVVPWNLLLLYSSHGVDQGDCFKPGSRQHCSNISCGSSPCCCRCCCWLKCCELHLPAGAPCKLQPYGINIVHTPTSVVIGHLKYVLATNSSIGACGGYMKTSRSVHQGRRGGYDLSNGILRYPHAKIMYKLTGRTLSAFMITRPRPNVLSPHKSSSS